MASGEQRCKKGKGCISQATHWEYPTMGPPRVICTKHALASQSRVTPFWSEGLPVTTTEAQEDKMFDLKSDDPSPGDLREWARENGFTIGDRGRVSAEIREAYRNAND